MKKTYLGLVLAISLFAATGCNNAPETPQGNNNPPPKPPASAAASPAQANASPAQSGSPTADAAWVPYKAADNNISFELPGKPETQDEPQKDGTKLHIVALEKDKVQYIVFYSDQLKNTSPEAAKAGMDAMAASVTSNYNVISKKDTKVSGHDAVSYELEDKKDKSRMRAHMFIANGHIYLTMVGGDPEVRKAHVDDIKRFMKSIKIADQAVDTADDSDEASDDASASPASPAADASSESGSPAADASSDSGQ